MKRYVTIVLVICMVLVASTSIIFAQGADDVTINIFSKWSSDIPSDIYYREHITKMSESDNGITIIQNNQSDEEAYYDKLRTRFATGEFPNMWFD